ncbi:MAG: hypothetical protein FJ118_07530 [Deltaproteobacteria bacterium]|nr:hypothetical protein [Deltaproteobacteria bacterium]
MDRPRSTEEALRVVEAFDALPLKRRTEIFRTLSPAAKETLLGAVSRPGDLTRGLSEEEMYYTIKVLGEESAPHLVAATTGRQLRRLLDLELWKKDMFDPWASAKWLELIAKTSEEKILQFVQTCDPELLVTSLHPFVTVFTRNPDIDLTEERDTLPWFTLDDLFFVKFRIPSSEDVIKGFLETVFGWNPHYYMGLMEQLARGVPTEHQEMAAKWRRARLSEHGFPDFDDAMQVYQYLHKSAVALTPPEMPPPPAEDREPTGVLDYPLKLINEDDLLKKSLDLIDDADERDRLAAELAHLGNKVMVADARDPGSMEDLRRSLQKVGGYINLALEDMCGDQVEQAVDVLRANHMEMLFRRGFSLILDLRKDAQKLVRESEGGVDNLGHPLAGLLHGLFQKRPIFALNVVDGREPRDFQGIDDLNSIRQYMDRQAIEERWEPI